MKLEEDILFELQHLPRSLPELHRIAFDQITSLGKASHRLARKTLQLLIVAFRPILWDELLFLLSKVVHRPVTKAEVLDVTSNFLDDDKESDQARFAHTSARDYIESRPEFQRGASNLAVAMMCLEDLVKPLEIDITKPVFTYSTLYVAKHLSLTTLDLRRPYHKPLRDLFSYERPDMRLPPSTLHPHFSEWRRRVYEFDRNHLLGIDSREDPRAIQEALISEDPILATCAIGTEELIPEGAEKLPILTMPNHAFFPNLSWEAQDALGHYQNRSPIQLAILFGRPQVLTRLAQLGVSLNKPDSEGEYLVHLAAKVGDAAVLKTLLSCGADPNRLTEEQAPVQQTVLVERNPNRPLTAMGFRSYLGGKAEISSPFRTKRESKAPVHLCAERQSGIPCLRVLIEHGCDVNKRTTTGTTPLQLALEAGSSRPQTMALLLQAGADIEARLEGKQTALHLAAVMGLEDAVRLLLDYGAHPRVYDSFGRTPGDLAVRYNHIAISGILVRAHEAAAGKPPPPPPVYPTTSSLYPPQSPRGWGYPGQTNNSREDGPEDGRSSAPPSMDGPADHLQWSKPPVGLAPSDGWTEVGLVNFEQLEKYL